MCRECAWRIKDFMYLLKVLLVLVVTGGRDSDARSDLSASGKYGPKIF
jgi:hypothetical protein